MTDKELDKLKAEIGYKRTCGTCTDCGECDIILKMAIKERQELKGDKQPEKPCGSCRM